MEPQLVLEILYVNSLIKTQEFAVYSVDTQNSTAHSPFPSLGQICPDSHPCPDYVGKFGKLAGLICKCNFQTSISRHTNGSGDETSYVTHRPGFLPRGFHNTPSRNCYYRDLAEVLVYQILQSDQKKVKPMCYNHLFAQIFATPCL